MRPGPRRFHGPQDTATRLRAIVGELESCGEEVSRSSIKRQFKRETGRWPNPTILDQVMGPKRRVGSSTRPKLPRL
jgi:hypothetical protein